MKPKINFGNSGNSYSIKYISIYQALLLVIPMLTLLLQLLIQHQIKLLEVGPLLVALQVLPSTMPITMELESVQLETPMSILAPTITQPPPLDIMLAVE